MSYNGITPAFQADNVGSIPTTRSIFLEKTSVRFQVNISSQGEELIPPIKPVSKTVYFCELGVVREPVLVKYGHIEARIIFAPRVVGLNSPNY